MDYHHYAIIVLLWSRNIKPANPIFLLPRYALMLSCWSAMPIERPTFSCLQARLQELLEQNEQSNKPVINLDAIIDLQRYDDVRCFV